MVAISLQVRQTILLDKILQREQNMSSEQDDKTTTRHMAITFVLFVALCIALIIGANLIA